MDPNGSRSKFIYYDNMVYKSWIDCRFTLIYKGILIITQSCIRFSEQSLWIRLID